MCTDFNLISVLSAGAEIGHNVEMFTGGTNLTTRQLTTDPTIREVGAIAKQDFNWINWPIEVVSNDGDFSGQSLCNKHPRCELSSVGGGDVLGLLLAKTVQSIPVTLNVIRPLNGDVIQFRLWAAMENGSGQFGAVPRLNEPSPAGIRPAGVADNEEYELVAKCRNLAMKVVWNSGILVSSQTVGGHYKLIFREIEDSDRPIYDLGRCRIRHKHESYENKFSHVTRLSGAASVMGLKLDASQDSVPSCLGCTLVVSQNGHAWYEIIAVQEALALTKRDP
jgi:hypothetical protein